MEKIKALIEKKLSFVERKCSFVEKKFKKGKISLVSAEKLLM